MVEQTAEKVEKSVEKAPPPASNLAVTNEQFASSRTPTEARPNVVQDGQIKFAGNIYGPDGINPELAVPLKPAKPGDPIKTGDGKIVAPVTDNAGNPTDNPASVSNDAGVIKSRQDLAKLTDGMTADQKREVQADMAAIENRKPPLSADQVKSIYDSTSKLLKNEGDHSPLSGEERNQLAGSILHNASLRTGTDQGFHNTCNVTTLERRLNVTNPAEAARIVSEVGLTGEFKSKDGKVIKLDQASLHEDNESRLQFGDKATDGKRNYASQLFDMAEVNNYWQHQKPPLFYSQESPTSQSDTGERLKYANGAEVKGPDGKPMRQPALSTDAMAEIGKDLGFTGKFIISNADVAGPEQSDGTSKVHNYQEFTDALTNGQPPAIIMVNSNDTLFGGNGDKGGSGGWHVVNVSDYKAGPPAQVFMTNQWGSANNKWVNVSDLYNATLPSNNGRVGLDGQGGGQTDGGDHGQGGGQQGGGDQGGGRRGWSRNDGVMRDEDFQSFKKSLVEPTDDKKDKKQPQPQIDQQIQPLREQLNRAIRDNDQAQADLLRAQIHNLQGTSSN